MITHTEFFKCLADDTRLNATLLIFAEGELCVCELIAALGDSQPKISRHLAQLRSCRVLADERKAQWVYYRLHDELPNWARQILKITADAHKDQLTDYRASLDSMSDRPAACC